VKSGDPLAVLVTSAVSAIANGGSLYNQHVISNCPRRPGIARLTGALAPTEAKKVIRPRRRAAFAVDMEGVCWKAGLEP